MPARRDKTFQYCPWCDSALRWGATWCYYCRRQLETYKRAAQPPAPSPARPSGDELEADGSALPAPNESAAPDPDLPACPFPGCLSAWPATLRCGSCGEPYCFHHVELFSGVIHAFEQHNLQVWRCHRCLGRPPSDHTGRLQRAVPAWVEESGGADVGSVDVEPGALVELLRRDGPVVVFRVLFPNAPRAYLYRAWAEDWVRGGGPQC